MHIVVAPQEFKGSLTSSEAARAIAAGVRRARPHAAIDESPVSDGGSGLVDVLLSARGGERRSTRVHDPLMRPVDAAWALLSDATAAIEMAAASGLVLVAEEERDVLAATSVGAGELIISALDAGCRTIIVGVGGSATVDAGAGAIQALGARLLDASGADVARGGAALAQLDRIDLAQVDKRIIETPIVVASDVRNPLCGTAGAARVFGPQKGASPEDVETLERALQHFAAIARRDFNIDLNAIEGAGAAGGLGAGLMIAAGATIEPGFPIIAEAIGLRARIERGDLVITGEGRLDSQTAYGKAAAGVAALARECRRPVVAVAGSVGDYDPSSRMFDAVISSTPTGMTANEAMQVGASLVADAAERLVREFLG
jgi:glycerate kinase